ncbi:response regulator [Bradyrhizobium sp. CCBAU 53351]|uniref:response regulator n=1 Tax=Bradyrhizobium sp. CCBAU 53351 TaxID=1325114 RepID=UPI001887DDFB|nr:response regulator [Bradyrhizobium sp. CCBAU 53351]
MKIAVMEDEYFIADDFAVEIRRRGHETVGPFAELSAAFQAASSAAIDAALLDIDLQGEASLGVADLLLKRDIPFLIYTGYSREVIPSRLAGYVVEKPNRIRDVLDRLFRDALAHGSPQTPVALVSS